MKKKIAVIFGGNSVEHEISIITAVQAMENIDKNKYEVFPIYISKTNNWYYSSDFYDINIFKNLAEVESKYPQVTLIKNGDSVNLITNKTKLLKSNVISQIDLGFLIVHGTNVEDGTLSGYLKSLDLIFVGPSVTSGVTGQDKAIMKDILKANDVKQTKYSWYFNNRSTDSIADDIINELGENVIIKPANLGSSIGINIASNREEIINYVSLAFEYDHKIVVEEVLTLFQELNISIMGNYKEMVVSKTEEVIKEEDFLSYSDKYMSGGSKAKKQSTGMASLGRIIPANVSDEILSVIEENAKKTYQVLNCQGVVRIDIMVSNGEVYINEVNSIPGSLAFYLWEATDISYPQLLDNLIENAIKMYFLNQKITYAIDTNVLNMQGVKNKK